MPSHTTNFWLKTTRFRILRIADPAYGKGVAKASGIPFKDIPKRQSTGRYGLRGAPSVGGAPQPEEDERP